MEARQVLLSALQANPSNVEILIALLKDTLKTRDLPAALSYAERLRKLRPEDGGLTRLIEQLRGQAKQ